MSSTQTLKVPEVLERLQVSRATLWRITQPRGPLYALRVGRSVRYPVEALDAYIAGRRFAPAGGPDVQPDTSTWPPTPSIMQELLATATDPRCSEEVSRNDHAEPCGRPAVSVYAHETHGAYPVCAAHSKGRETERIG